MGTQKVADDDFNVLQFEKQLLNLKDSQEAINTCCQWCLQNRTHHKKIVNSWLNVLKRVKVEQRLVLFYLANDVVQYSKRKNFDFVESWGTALQKATTMVRDEKVKHKILRIFKIWEQRGVYNEEFISDLCGLLSVLPSAPKNDEPHEFQPSYVVTKIKTCSKLEKDTDTKLKLLNEHNPKIQIGDGLIGSLKDRVHVDDVEKEIEVYIKHMEDYINALKLEIKNRITLISVLKQAETQLEADRKDVKVVANAYKMFGTRVKTFQRKLEEHRESLNSPIPSPDINAPSPSPDSDIDLPEEPNIKSALSNKSASNNYNPKVDLQFSSNYYTPVTSAVNDSSIDVGSSTFLSANGFSSFIGSETFNLENFNSSLFSNVSNFTNSNDSITEQTYTPPKRSSQNPPLPVEAPSTQPSFGYDPSHVPLLPPPMPPFSKAEDDFGRSGSYEATYTSNSEPAIPFKDSYESSLNSNRYQPNDEYNPEDDVTTWEPDGSWNSIPPVPDTEDSVSSSLGTKDVDHRNLISLTGSPGQSNSQNSATDSLWNQSDQDYRIPPQANPSLNLPAPPISSMDQDYRIGFSINQLKLPPPPPPPPKFHDHKHRDSLHVESPENIDMDLSDEDSRQHKHDNLKVIIDGHKNNKQSQFMLEPPPPLPELPEDDANNIFDDLSNDFDNDEDKPDAPLLLPPPPLLNFNNLMGPPIMPHMNTSMLPPPLLQPPPMIPGRPLAGPNSWMAEEERSEMINQRLNEESQWAEDMDHSQNNWGGPQPLMSFNDFGGFRGRNGARGNFNNRGNKGRNRNKNQNRGNGNFRGNRGGNRGFFHRGNFRGAFQRGGF
ncbi:unnamed protein product [Phyllotreta striolata]|uniref:Regulation of nuclear pre-mRNA domain-containing protein 2 n=1 Tax=Phyllotreta striolata TaxID=444603 RepID=A0A9N9TAE6_PHYSR|nr:unnamed protein product [Phyllotreta striolata]